jgi:hypothetical protein
MTSRFEQIIIGGKVSLVITLLIMSFINGHKDYIQNNPRKFIADSFLTGLTSGIAAAFLCMSRGRPDLIFNSFLLTFLFFFFYGVCREMSGYFAFMGNGKLTQGEDDQKKLLKLPITIMIGVILLLTGSIVLINRVTPDLSMGILSKYSYPFLLELFVFSAIASSGEFVVGINHGENPAKALTSGFIIFAVSHLILQYGGFYNQVFSPKTFSPNING